MDVFDIVNYKYKTRTCQQIKISDINYQDFKKLEPCKCIHPYKAYQELHLKLYGTHLQYI